MQSFASLEDALSEGFATASGAGETYEIGDRTVHTGGYIRIRIPTAPAPQLMTVEGPSIQGGCNGFDMYGGSFSMISADELVNWLERVTDNSGALLTFTFITYLKDQCAVCSDGIEWLYDLQDALNSSMSSSCEAAQMITGGISQAIETNGDSFVTPEMEAYGQQQARNWSKLAQNSGEHEDAAESLNKKSAGVDDNLTQRQETADEVGKENAAMISGANLAYWLVHSGGAKERFEGLMGGEPNEYEELMPLIFAVLGTEIYTEDMTAGSTEKGYEQIVPWVGVKSMWDYDEDLIEITANLKCDDTSTDDPFLGCTEPSTFDFKLEDPMEEFDKHMEGSTGIVEKIGTVDGGASAQITNAQKTYVRNTPGIGPLVRDLTRIAKYDQAEKNKFYRDYKDVIKLNFLKAWFDEFLRAAEYSAKAVAWPDGADSTRGKLLSLIEKRQKAINDEYTNLMDIVNTGDDSYNELLNNAIKSAKTTSGAK